MMSENYVFYFQKREMDVLIYYAKREWINNITYILL